MWKHWFDSGFVFEPRKEKEKFERSEWKKLWQTKITNAFYPHHFCDFCFFLRRLHTHLLLVPRRRLATTIHLKHQALRQTPLQRDLDYHQVKLLYQVKSRINWYVIHEVLSSSRKLKQRRFWAAHVNRKYGLFSFWYALPNNAKCPLPVGERRSKTSVLKLPSVENLTLFSSSLRLGRWQKMRAIR